MRSTVSSFCGGKCCPHSPSIPLFPPSFPISFAFFFSDLVVITPYKPIVTQKTIPSTFPELVFRQDELLGVRFPFVSAIAPRLTSRHPHKEIEMLTPNEMSTSRVHRSTFRVRAAARPPMITSLSFLAMGSPMCVQDVRAR